MNYHEIIRHPIVTEKSELIKSPKKDVQRYTLRVHKRANKESIRQAIYRLYKVRITKVNIMNNRGKMKRFRTGLVQLPAWKKAVITLTSGESIDFSKKS